MIVKLYRDGAFPAADGEIDAKSRLEEELAADEPHVTRLQDETERLRGKFGLMCKQAVNQVFDYSKHRINGAMP